MKFEADARGSLRRCRLMTDEQSLRVPPPRNPFKRRQTHQFGQQGQIKTFHARNARKETISLFPSSGQWPVGDELWFARRILELESTLARVTWRLRKERRSVSLQQLDLARHCLPQQWGWRKLPPYSASTPNNPSRTSLPSISQRETPQTAHPKTLSDTY
jgi:hypothetical protein